MIPGMDPKMVKMAMKKMGIKQTELEATEVIIKTKDKIIIIQNPEVLRVNAMGQDSFQISGDIIEQEKELFTEDDIKTVQDQTNCTKEEAKNALESEGDLAGAILKLTSQ